MLIKSQHLNKITLNVIEVVQQNEKFYIAKIRAKDLINIATVHTRNTKENYDLKYLKEAEEVINTINISNSDQGIQRVLQVKRLKEIAEYTHKYKGILPGNLIVSINNKFNWDSDDEFRIYEEDGFELTSSDIEGVFKLVIYPAMIDAFIIDGQHRLASFSYAKELIDSFELPITIFLDLKTPVQAELFARINGTQKPVKKSLLYDLTEFEQSEYNSIKKCHSIAKLFNNNENSPFYNKIDMLGSTSGRLSQAAFIDELIRYVKNRKFNNYKSFLQHEPVEEIVDILYRYFSAIKNAYEREWNDTQKYFVLRTTGFGAFMKLLYYVYIYFKSNNIKFERKELGAFFIKVHDIEEFSVESIGKVGSQGVQKQLCDKIVSEMIGDNKKISILEDSFKKEWNDMYNEK